MVTKRWACGHVITTYKLCVYIYIYTKKMEDEEEEKMVGPKRPQFVLFGSSVVQLSYINEGWGAILSTLYARKADILLRGYSGWNSRRGLLVLQKIFPKDAAVQPDLVIVYFGGNDSMHPHPTGLGPHVPLPEYIDNMRKIALYLKSLSENTRVIFLTAPPVNEEQIRQSLSGTIDVVRTNKECRRYSEALLELCREMNLKVVDLWTTMQQIDNWSTVCFTDGIHFSSEGSKLVVKEIMKVIREAEWEPSLHWRAMPSEFAEDSPYDLVSPDGITVNVSELGFPANVLELE